MYYIEKVLNFLNSYSAVILPVLFAIIPFFGIVNWICNVYRRQNKKLTSCYRNLCARPDKVNLYANHLP